MCVCMCCVCIKNKGLNEVYSPKASAKLCVCVQIYLKLYREINT